MASSNVVQTFKIVSLLLAVCLVANVGLNIGGTLAIVLSYDHSHSVLWAILDGVLGWVYVLWAFLMH